MTTLWCELAWLGGEQVEPGVVLEIADDRIVKVNPRTAEPPTDAERLTGLTIPGLVNAHSHAFQRALRGRTEGGTGTFWTWRDQMYELAELLDPDSYRALARAVFGEMALAGISHVGEFHYLHHGPGGKPYDDPNAMGMALIEAAAEAGLRISLIDACYLAGGIGQDLQGAQLRFGDGDAAAWANRAAALPQGPALRVLGAIHSVRAVPPDQLGVVSDWGRGEGRQLHIHLSEQPAENQACCAAYGKTPTELLAANGVLDDSLVAVHGTHLSASDLSLLSDAGARVCLCPTTERDLADGIGRALDMRNAGIGLSLGSDSNAFIDLFEETRAVELDERLASGQRGLHRAIDLLTAATAGGALALGWSDAGTLAASNFADLAVLDLDSVRLAGTRSEDLIEAVVFGASPSEVRHVMVGGRWVVREGAHLFIDVPKALAEAIPSRPSQSRLGSHASR